MSSVSGLRMGLAVVALAIAGCGGAEGSEACVMPPVDMESTAPEGPGAKPQGRWSNGTWTNGTWTNGTWTNGTWTNGTWTNGFERQGLELHDLPAQDVNLNGATLGALGVDGTVLSGADLVGAELKLLSGERLTIAGYEADASDAELGWYTLTHRGRNICGDGVKGTFVGGVWDPEGARLAVEGIADSAAPFTFSCTTGVIGKCVVAGYKPWLGERFAELHQSCTRMMRADYCGDGVPHTENGTRIDVVDVEGIQVRESKPGELAFEAAWGPDGAVCVNQTRYADTVMGQGAIAPSCWNALPRCTDLVESAELGGLIANYSQQGKRNFCEQPREY